MPLVLNKSGGVFLHVYKTGGTWVNAALTRGGVGYQHYGYPHANLAASRKIVDCTKTATVIRNPFAWYASFFAYRHLLGWGGDLAIGHDCRAATFKEFVHRCSIIHPGFLGELYGEYVAPEIRVMRTRSLAADLVAWLRSLGEEFDEERLASTPRVNAAATLPGWTHLALYDEEAAQMLRAAERKTFIAYGYSMEVPDTLKADRVTE